MSREKTLGSLVGPGVWECGGALALIDSSSNPAALIQLCDPLKGIDLKYLLPTEPLVWGPICAFQLLRGSGGPDPSKREVSHTLLHLKLAEKLKNLLKPRPQPRLV